MSTRKHYKTYQNLTDAQRIEALSHNVRLMMEKQAKNEELIAHLNRKVMALEKG